MGADEYIAQLSDAMAVLRGMSGATSGQWISIDVNGDQKVGLPEAVFILQDISAHR